MSVRKAHNSGRNHLRNVVDYYQRTSLPLRRARSRDPILSSSVVVLSLASSYTNPLQKSDTKRPNP